MKAEFSVILRRLVYLFTGVFILIACATTNKDEKFYARQEAKQLKQEEQDYEKRVKQHKQIQSKETLKMMRQREKEARKMNRYKKR